MSKEEDIKNYTAYCMKCKKRTEIKNPEEVIMKGKGERRAVRGKCIECDTNVYAILKKKE